MCGLNRSAPSAMTGIVMGVLCALAATFQGSSAAVIRSPGPVWMNSCNTNGATNLADLIGLVPDRSAATTEELHHVYGHLLEGAELAKQLVTTLEVEYRTARPVLNVDNAVEEAPGWFELTGLPHIVPLSQETITNINAISEARTTFSELAHAAVFLEQIVLDVTEHESREVANKFEQMRLHNLAMLCHMTKVLAHHQSSVSTSVASDVMTQQWASPNSTVLRQLRDIITLRYIRTSLEKTQTAFRHLKRQLPSS